MNPPENLTQPSPDQLQEKIRSLQSLLNLSLATILLLGGAVFIFLFRELSISRRQIGQLQSFVSDYEVNTQPRLEKFQQELQIFAEKDPEFRKILERYMGDSTLQRLTPAENPPELQPPN